MLVALLIKILTIGDDQALWEDYLKLIIVIIALHGFYCGFKFYRISAEFVTINRHIWMLKPVSGLDFTIIDFLVFWSCMRANCQPHAVLA